MDKEKAIFCFGEIVWDSLPAGIFLGGAPLNVAFHLSQLGTDGVPISAISNDFLGRETIRRLSNAGVRTDQIQENSYPTGAVIATVDESGNATYEILQPSAWDFIKLDEQLRSQVEKADGFVFGTLASRNATTNDTLLSLKETAQWTLYDVNLRPPFYDIPVVESLAHGVDWLKLNDEELTILLGTQPASIQTGLHNLARNLGCMQIVLTMGEKGAAIWADGDFRQVPAPKIEVANTVGAGDAFTASFVHSIHSGQSPIRALKNAVTLGAFVATRPGAQPSHEGKTQ